MGKYIINLDGYYMEWSTVVDAPVTWGMSLAAFQDYYLQEYGESEFSKLDERLDGKSKTWKKRIERCQELMPMNCDCIQVVGNGTIRRLQLIEPSPPNIAGWYSLKKTYSYVATNTALQLSYFFA